MVKLEEANINFSGADIVKVAKDMFKTDKPTVEQIQYVIPMLRPTNYLLEHHTIAGHPITYSIPNYGNHDFSKYFGHRPWQRAVLNDQSQSKVIIKSRQLGFSEVGVSEVIWFCDTHSYDNVSALYTFPKIVGRYKVTYSVKLC